MKQSLRPFIESLFKETIEDLSFNPQVFEKYFSPSYVQHVDGKALSYLDFLEHMQAQKTALSKVKITIEQFIEQGNVCSTIHVAHATTKDGREIVAKVIAHFTIQDGKLIACDELTHLLKGEHRDRDIGSRT